MATTTQPKTYGVKEIAKLFPSLMKIKQRSLREKVATVWSEAITTGCGGEGRAVAVVWAGQVTVLAGRHRLEFVQNHQFSAPPMNPFPESPENAFPTPPPI